MIYHDILESSISIHKNHKTELAMPQQKSQLYDL